MLIAEFSHNHKGNISILEDMVRASSRAGARFCKIQTFFADDLAPDWRHTRDHVLSYELSWHKHKQVFEMCRDYKVFPMATVYAQKYAQKLQEIGFEWIKIGSPQAMNLELISFYKMIGFKVIISTGGRELKFLPRIYPLDGVLHCNSVYPTKPETANLGRMLEIKRYWPRTAYGYSSHVDPLEKDWDVPLKLASYLGATYIECHFTTLPRDQTKDGKVSLDESQLKQICDFDYLSKEEKLRRYPWFGYFSCPQPQEEFDLISKYEGRWKCGLE